MTELEPPTDDLRALFAQERDISDVERVAIRPRYRVLLSLLSANRVLAELACGVGTAPQQQKETEC